MSLREEQLCIKNENFPIPSQVLISVIIPTYKDWKTLGDCLELLKKQTLSTNLFEVIVVNNDPADTQPTNMELAANVRVLSESRPGSYAARNKGIRESKGDILAFTDSDCKPHATWLEESLKLMSFHNEVDLIGGDIQLFKLPTGDVSAYLFEKHYAFKQKMNVERYGKSVTANLIVRKKVFDQVGMFDDSTFSGEDNRWTSMVVSKGYKMVYSPLVQVSHPARISMDELVRKRKRTIGGYYTLHYRSLSFRAKVKSHIVAVLAPVKTIVNIEEASVTERVRVLVTKWRIEWAAFWELIGLSLSAKDQLRGCVVMFAFFFN